MIVHGLDVAATTVSVCRMDTYTAALPKVKLFRAPSAPDVHSVKTADARIRALAGDVVTALTRDATPDLVVMVRHTWRDMRSDPSAYRRASVHRDIVRALLDAGVRIADVPLLTLMSWAGVQPKMGAPYLDALTRDTKKRHPGITQPEGFSTTAVVAAGIGAQALGQPSGWGFTDRRYAVMTARASGVGVEKQVGPQWPKGLPVPPTKVA